MRNPNARLAWGAVVSALALSTTISPSPALADSLTATRSDQLNEVSHRVEVLIDRGFATLVVRRTVFNGGERHDQALFSLELPDGAAAVGLRTLGMLDGRPHWFTGDLLEAETAAARYKELTGIGGYYPKDPALLSWRGQGYLALQVFPCAPGANKSVEYTLSMPTEYESGRHHLRLPRMGTASLAATLAIRSAHTGDRLLVDDRYVQNGTELPFGSARELDIAMEAAEQPAITGALAVLPLSPDRAITRARIDVARKLSTIPSYARVVVLIDGSRSMGEGARQAAVAATESYLSQFPNGTAEVIRFDRAAHPMNGRLVPIATAIKDLKALPMTSANGSAVDSALETAASLIAASPGGERRVVVFTDTRTRASLAMDQLRTRLGSVRGIVHVAVPNRGNARLDRDDDHDWSATVKSTGGLVWSLSADQDEDDLAERNTVFTELARPVRLHHVAITSGGFLSEEVTSIETLDEGQGVSDLQLGKPASGWFTVQGELWTRPVRSTTNGTEDENRRWSALVFGSDLVGDLSEPEMMQLAKRGGAVSPVTSYLAIEPGVRPSTEGLEESGGVGFGATGSGIGVGMGAGSLGHTRAPFDHHAWLRSVLAPAWAACGGAQSKATVVIETTSDEIVDVPSITSNARDIIVSCLREAVWRVELPSAFSEYQSTYEIDL